MNDTITTALVLFVASELFVTAEPWLWLSVVEGDVVSSGGLGA